MIARFLLPFSSTLILYLYCAIMGQFAAHTCGLWSGFDQKLANRYLKWFFAISLGLAFVIAVLFLLGIIGYLSLSSIFAVSSILVIPIWHSLYYKTRLLPEVRLREDYKVLVTLFLLQILMILFALRTPGCWDDTSYHLPMARFYKENNALVLNKYLRFPLNPQNFDILFSLGLMLQGDLLAQAFATMSLVISSIGMIGAAYWLTESFVIGLMSAVSLFLLEPVQATIGCAYVDIGHALFCWGAIIAIAIWSQTKREQRGQYNWLIVAGILAGLAAGTKMFGLVLAMFCGAYVLILRRDIKAALVYSLALLGAGSWWYFRSFWISGDPVHPLGGRIFGFFLWDAGDLLELMAEQATHGIPPMTLNFWAAFKMAGVLFWVLAVLTVPFRKQTPPIRWMQFIFIAYVIFWFFVSQVERYLSPIYATATFLSWYFIHLVASNIGVKRRLDVFLRPYKEITSVLLMGIVIFPLIGKQYKAAQLSVDDRQLELENRQGYKLFSLASRYMPKFGTRLIHIGLENAVYFFEGTAIGDHMGIARYRDMMDCVLGKCRVLDPEQMLKIMHKFDAKMLIISTTYFSEIDKEKFEKKYKTLKNLNELQMNCGVALKGIENNQDALWQI